MTHIAFFGHNADDAAIRRRAIAFQSAGFKVSGFMHNRGIIPETEWDLTDLGETADNDYLQRVKSIFSGARVAQMHRDRLETADVFYARNLDMLASASLVRRKLKLKTPLVYECLDVHHKLTSSGVPARVLRGIEGRMMRGCSLLTVSSPAFLREYFDVHHPDHPPSFLLENRLIRGDSFPARPGGEYSPAGPDGKLRLGWFGNLRCARSLAILTRLADRFRDSLEIHLRGYPAPGVFTDFEALLAPHPNIHFAGRYRAPQDLSGIYAGVDLVWAADWYEAGANSLWLLPNRIYEGGYFATPAIAIKGTETAGWLEKRNGGFLIGGPVDDELAGLVEGLLADPSAIAEKRAALLALDPETYVEERPTMHDMISAALQSR